METATLQLLAEIDAADGWSAERGAGILDQTARLFLCSVENLSASKIDLFDGVFDRLTDHVDTQSLARLSQQLSEAKCALPLVMRRLALHEDEAVSAPALKSRGIAQDILIEVIRSRGQAHHLAIASRHAIDYPLSEALIQSPHSAVHNRLVENRAAQVSEAGWIRLAQLAQRDPALAEKLGRRPDVPATIKRALRLKLEDARLRALSARQGVMFDRIAETIASGAASGLTHADPADIARVQAQMAELARQGKLKDSTVNRFAATREYLEVAAALTLLTGSSIDVIRAMIASEQIEGLVIACKAARLAWGTTNMIVKNRPGMPPVPDEEMDKARKTFESVSLSAAQLTVRF